MIYCKPKVIHPRVNVIHRCLHEDSNADIVSTVYLNSKLTVDIRLLRPKISSKEPLPILNLKGKKERKNNNKKTSLFQFFKQFLNT